MGQLDTHKWIVTPKYMTKDELIELRDQLKSDRTWGTALTSTIIGGLSYISGIAGYLSFALGVGLTWASSFAEGADDRVQDILDNYNCDDGVYVKILADGRFNITGTELYEMTYIDVLGASETEFDPDWA